MEFQARITHELDRLAALAPNWDAEGSRPIDSRIIAAAREFAQHLPENLVAPPAVVPMAKGNFQFEWHDGPRTLELEFETPTTIHYLKWHPEEGVEEEDAFPISDYSQAEALVRWFSRSMANV